MGFLNWLTINWFSFLQIVGIIGGLLFSGISFRNLRVEQRITNLLTIKEQHDELWKTIYERPELARVLDPGADLAARPISQGEELFVTLAVVHLNTSCQALLRGMLEPNEGLRQDIRWFFSLPIPKAVWEKIKERQDPNFVKFVEACRAG
jgi:hypothetical protein